MQNEQILIAIHDAFVVAVKLSIPHPHTEPTRLVSLLGGTKM